MRQDDDTTASLLRGRLSEVFLEALTSRGEDSESMTAALLKRLGPKAAIDEPILGASLPGGSLTEHVSKVAAWLSERGAEWTPKPTIVGTTLDATEGLVVLREGLSLPVAVVVERKREREVAVRMHFSTTTAGVTRRGPSLEQGEFSLTGFASDALLALSGKGAVGLCFEQNASLRNGSNQESPLAEGLANGGFLLDPSPTGLADDGLSICIEVISKGSPALVVLERGDSGLVRSVRFYGDT